MNDKSLRTLIVDDSEDDVLLIIRELKKGGYNPLYERVETAAKMKKNLRENQWDIILCDYRLPKFNAPSAIALLKETNLNIPVIVISGKIGEETAVECMRLGARDYILKDNLIRLCPAIARELEEAKVREREKQAAEALRESEKKYQMLFDNSIDAIAVFGGKPPKFLFVNPAFLRLFGYTLEEILAFSANDIFLTVHPDDREMVKKHLRDRFRQEDKHNRYEFRVVTKNGQVRWVDISATLFSTNGQFLSQAICRDITDRKRIEVELRESEKKYRAFFDTSRDCVYITSLDGKLVDVNDAAIGSFGYSSRDELMRLKIPDLYVKNEERAKLIDTLMEKGFCKDYPVDMRKKDGEVMHALITATVEYDADGKAKGFMGTIKDITDRKRVEEALLNSHRRLEDIIDFLPDATFVVDCEGKVIAWNRSTERITGISKAEMIGRGNYEHAIPFYGQRRPGLVDLALLPDEIFENMHYENVYRQGDTLFAETFVPRIYRGKGAFMWGMASRLCDTSGNIVGAIVSIRDVTDRKNAESALQDSHRRLEDIIDFLPDSTFVINREGKIVAWNRSTERITGISKVEMIGRGNYEYALPFYGRRRPILIDLALLPDEIYENNHYENVHRQGDTLFAETYVPGTYGGKGAFMWGTASRLRDASGNIIGAIESIRDITDRKQAEERLYKSEKKFSSIFHLNSDPMVISDIDTGGIIDVNQAYINWTGYSREEIIGNTGETLHLWINPDDRKKIIDKLKVEGKVNGEEILARQKNGNVRNMLISARFIEIDQQFYLLMSGHDITDRKRIEEKLRKSELTFRSLFEASPIGIFTVLNRKFIQVNPAMCKATGYSLEDLIGHSVRICYWNDEEYERAGKILYGGITRVGVGVVETRLRRRNGEEFDVLICLNPIDPQDNSTGYEGIMMDITERRRAEEEIRRTQEQMRAFAIQLQTVREEERTRIAREIHDELGGALTGIKIDLSLLKKAAAEIKEKALKDHLIGQIHNTTKLIDKTIGTVRKISTELRPGILDDLGILATLEWQLNDFQKRTNTRCKWISSLEDIDLEEHEATAMFRIFQETLINVARHAGATEVQVQIRNEENAYFLEIEDNGKGITKKNIDDKRSLGLLGMRERALAIGGRIDIKGHPGKGTKVIVEIPFKQADNYNPSRGEESTP